MNIHRQTRPKKQDRRDLHPEVLIELEPHHNPDVTDSEDGESRPRACDPWAVRES